MAWKEKKKNTLRSTHNDAAGSLSRLAYFSVDRNMGKSSWPHKINKENSQLTRTFLPKKRLARNHLWMQPD